MLKILVLLGACAAALPLVACGQKGPLTHPSPQGAANGTPTNNVPSAKPSTAP